MRSGSFTYLFKQGITNIWLNRVMSLASVGILTACLIIVGGAALLSINVRDVFAAIEQENEVVVFVADDASEAEISTLGKSITAMEQVNTIEYVSKADALAEQKEYMGDEGYLLDGLEDDNPYPASYRIQMKELNGMSEFKTQLEALPSVDSVSAPTLLADTLTGIERTLFIFGGIIVGILLIASLVVINNTIKLTVFSRRREINIMKYVGATNAFIRFPFVIEGIALGLISAIIAFFVLLAVYQSLSNMLVSSPVPWIASLSGSFISFWSIWHWLAGAFAIGGTLIGALGSSAAMRQHLKV